METRKLLDLPEAIEILLSQETLSDFQNGLVYEYNRNNGSLSLKQAAWVYRFAQRILKKRA